ncbi:MAG: inorganic phosphate transporter [bacterium]
MDIVLVLLILAIVLALFFDYTNGFHDAANAIATVVSTRVLTPKFAVILAAIFNLMGALISIEVATTVGKGLVDPKLLDITTILAIVIGAIIWNLITWYFGLPTSSSHALIGAIIGSAISHYDFKVVNYLNLINKVFFPSIFAPVLGIIGGIIFLFISYLIASKIKAYLVNRLFRYLQLFSASFMALSHGSNDAQKTMGIISMALVAANVYQEFTVPLWVKLSAAIAIALGTLAGGWRIIKTIGMRLTKLRPIDGFSAEISAATMIMLASHFGMPISTTYVITSSIMGVGVAKKLNAIKWSLAFTILTAWLFTIPASATVAFITYKILNLFIKI